MKRINKKMTSMAILAVLSCPGVVFAENEPLESGMATCGLPVCDMDSAMSALSGLNQNQRYNYATKLSKKHAKTQDVHVLENLLETSKKLKALCAELGDADWVLRAASSLGNTAILNLAKYSEINAKKSIELYKQLEGQANRFEVISYYQAKVRELEDSKQLSELVELATLMESHSIKVEDEAWVSRAAQSLASEATGKLVELDPSHEGVYDVKMVAGDALTLGIDKVVVLDSSSSKNLVVSFINSKHKKVVLSYPGCTIMGDKITGKIIGYGQMSSRFELQLDREAGKLTGKIQTTRTKEVSLEGTRTFTLSEIFEGKAPEGLTESEVLGEMRGKIMGIEGTLSVQSFEPNSISASFVADKGQLKVDFQGKLYLKRGVIALTHKDKVKMVLSLRKTGETTLWKGASFSVTSGKVSDATFESLANVFH